ncbi:MAG: DUF5337 family protein [Pseudomonadota bacterium]
MSDATRAAVLRRRAGLTIAGTGLYWVLITLIGDKEGFSQGVRLVFDLLALVGFGAAFWLIYLSWRAGQDR